MIFSPARCREPAPFVPILVDLDHGHGRADDEGVGRQLDVVLEGLPERPELLAVKAEARLWVEKRSLRSAPSSHASIQSTTLPDIFEIGQAPRHG